MDSPYAAIVITSWRDIFVTIFVASAAVYFFFLRQTASNSTPAHPLSSDYDERPKRRERIAAVRAAAMRKAQQEAADIKSVGKSYTSGLSNDGAPKVKKQQSQPPTPTSNTIGSKQRSNDPSQLRNTMGKKSNKKSKKKGGGKKAAPKSFDKEAGGESTTLEEKLGVSKDVLNLLKALDRGFQQKIEELGGDTNPLGVLDCTIADDELFQSPPPRPDCPICCLTLPLKSATYQPCCGKTLCDGCIYAHRKSSKEYNCPFCRTPVSFSDKERIARTKKRMDCNESDAYVMLAMHHYQGTKDVKRDYGKAVELWKKATELGPSDEGDLAHYYLGVMYANGHGVEKDEKKSMYHYRISAIGGNVNSRFNLALMANKSENAELAIKHLVIGAKAGHDESLAAIKKCYEQGFVQKDVFADVLRVHKVTNDEMKSVERDKAAKERASLGLTGRL